MEAAESSVAKYLRGHSKPLSQTWRAFLANHVSQIASIQQLREAWPSDDTPRFLLRDRDRIYGETFPAAVNRLGIDEILTAPMSPWQNPFADRSPLTSPFRRSPEHDLTSKGSEGRGEPIPSDLPSCGAAWTKLVVPVD